MSGKATRKARKRAALLDGITEMTAMEVTAIHGVAEPANGYPVLVMKRGSEGMAKRTPAERAARAERRLRKAERRVSRARYAAAEARHAVTLAAGSSAGGPSPAKAPAKAAVLPAPDAFDDHLLGKAAGGDETARELLRRRGTDSVYAAQLRDVLAKSTNPGMKAWAAGALAALDETFDPYAPLPRGAGSAW